MKRKHTVDQTTEKSRRGGSKIKGGCGITKTNVYRWSWTSVASYIHSGTRMRMLVPRLIHTWIIVQSGGKQERAHISSSGDDSCLMWETRLSRVIRMWTWRTSDHPHGWQCGHTTRWKRWHERRGGANRFTLFARFLTGFVCVLCFCSGWFLLVLWFWPCVVFCLFLAGVKLPASNSRFTFFALAFLESWPTMPRARSAMQEKKKKKTTHKIHVSNIHLHLALIYGKCR